MSISSFTISTVNSGSSVYFEITFEYSAFHLTDTAKALIEILKIETDDEFFRELAKHFKKVLKEKTIIIKVYNIEELE